MIKHTWEAYEHGFGSIGPVKTGDWVCSRCHAIVYCGTGNPSTLKNEEYEEKLLDRDIPRDCDESLCQYVLES